MILAIPGVENQPVILTLPMAGEIQENRTFAGLLLLLDRLLQRRMHSHLACFCPEQHSQAAQCAVGWGSALQQPRHMPGIVLGPTQWWHVRPAIILIITSYHHG